ncbi:MAG: Zn-ribbon domain-containing OB-fold protein [Novosphingobium sp.]
MTQQTGPEAHWRQALTEGRFLLQRSPADGRHFYPPRVIAPTPGGDALEWVEASGLGTVHSVTMISPKPPAEPYNVVLVDLAEGPRMMSRVEGVPASDVTIGMAVQARIDRQEDGEPILLFVPA